MNKIEKRNMKLINKWLTAWTLPGGSHQKMLDCYSYSDNLEVFAPIQEYYVVKKGVNKDIGIKGKEKLRAKQNQGVWSYQILLLLIIKLQSRE